MAELGQNGLEVYYITTLGSVCVDSDRCSPICCLLCDLGQAIQPLSKSQSIHLNNEYTDNAYFIKLA